MPFIFLALRTQGALRVVLLGLIVCPFLRQHLEHQYGFYTSYFLFPARFDSVLWGVLLASIMRNPAWLEWARRRLNALLVFALALFVLVVLRAAGQLNYTFSWCFTFLAIFYTIMMFAVLEHRFAGFNRLLCSRFLVYTGLISYGMYMYHQMINGLMHGFVFGDDSPHVSDWSSTALTMGSVVLVYGLATLSYRYLEKPILTRGHRYHFLK